MRGRDHPAGPGMRRAAPSRRVAGKDKRSHRLNKHRLAAARPYLQTKQAAAALAAAGSRPAPRREKPTGYDTPGAGLARRAQACQP